MSSKRLMRGGKGSKVGETEHKEWGGVCGGGRDSGPAGHSGQSQVRKAVLILVQNGIISVQNAH